MPEQHFGFTGCLGIQFFDSPLSLYITTKATFGTLPSLYLYLRYLQHTCCSIDHQVLPDQPLPREAEDSSRCGKYPMDVPLLTSHQKVWFGRFYLCVRASWETLYRTLASFELAVECFTFWSLFKSCFSTFPSIAFVCFSAAFSIAFVCFWKAFPNGKYVNFACSVTLIWSGGSIYTPVKYK